MTFLQIYNRVIYNLFGAPANVPQGLQNVLYFTNGIIDNIHRKIQQDRNYYFMETYDHIHVAPGTSSYVLPTGFKEIVRCGFSAVNAVTGNQERPLSQLGVGEQFLAYTSVTDTADYPLYYYIYNGVLYLKPIPSLAIVLNVYYYKYLDRLVNDADEDELTRIAYDAIINFACEEVCNLQKEFQEGQMYRQKAVEQLEIAMQDDMARRRAELKSIDYGGF